jgi:hypothetical protein
MHHSQMLTDEEIAVLQFMNSPHQLLKVSIGDHTYTIDNPRPSWEQIIMPYEPLYRVHCKCGIDVQPVVIQHYEDGYRVLNKLIGVNCNCMRDDEYCELTLL